MREGRKKIIKEFDRLTIWLFVISALFLLYGFYHYFRLGATVVSHPKSPEPSLSNGTTTIFFGVIFIVIAFYRIIRRSKLLKQLHVLKKSNK